MMNCEIEVVSSATKIVMRSFAWARITIEAAEMSISA